MNSTKTSDFKISPEDLAQLKQKALDVRQYAHSPYSKVRIGSAIRLQNGQIYSGCNIENASYGGTVCAERVAILKAYSENKTENKITHVVVASDEQTPWPPCGLCRQVIAEFASPETLIYLINTSEKEKALTFAELFPFAFQADHLLKK